jgi:hypothetical protein
MRALVWKELRENLKWALLAMLAMGGALWYALHATANGMAGSSSYSQDGITLCRKSFLLVTTFGSAAIGLLMGFLQILPELKRDRWAALCHRPVSGGTIFWGKVIAGVILYALAALPGFAVSVWQVATPGNFGVPFVPEMVKPGLADIAAGLAYYFAALTISLHSGGWMGLRLFPLLAAVHLSSFAHSTNYFRTALAATALMSLALVIAAWGAMSHRERLGARPWPARVAFLAVIFYGACGLGGLAKSVLKAVLPNPGSKMMVYEIMRDGTPLRLTYENSVVTQVADLEGKPVAEPRFRPDRVRNEIMYLNGFSSFIGDSHGWKPREYISTYRESDAYIWADSPYMFPRSEQWFFLRKQRYYLCFQPMQMKAVERLDARGFQPPSTPPDPLSPETKSGYASQDTKVIWDDDAVNFAFLGQRKILAVELPVAAPVYGVGHAWARINDGSVSVTGVVLGQGMAVYDMKGKPVTFLPYHYDTDQWGRIQMGVNGTLDRFYLQYGPSSWIEQKKRKTMPSYLEEVNAKGEVIRSFVLPPLPEFPRPTSLVTRIDRSLQSPALFFGEILYRKIGATLGSERLAKALAGQLAGSTVREIAWWSLSVSLVLATMALLLARRWQFSPAQAWRWAGFVFLFNLGGFLAFCLAADWPRLVACAGCRKKRRIDQDRCSACHDHWPAPSSNGTEIFDRTPEVTA